MAGGGNPKGERDIESHGDKDSHASKDSVPSRNERSTNPDPRLPSHQARWHVHFTFAVQPSWTSEDYINGLTLVSLSKICIILAYDSLLPTPSLL